jgi:hypothetical protein
VFGAPYSCVPTFLEQTPKAEVSSFIPTLHPCHCPPPGTGLLIQPVSNTYSDSLSLPSAIRFSLGLPLPFRLIHVVLHVHCSRPV